MSPKEIKLFMIYRDQASPARKKGNSFASLLRLVTTGLSSPEAIDLQCAYANASRINERLLSETTRRCYPVRDWERNLWTMDEKGSRLVLPTVLVLEDA